MREIEIQGLGKTTIPEDWDDEKVKANIAVLLKRFKKPENSMKPPQARIPVKVKFVRKTTGGQGIAVQLDTGNWLSCFDNRKMGEDGETQFSILLGATGKTCIFLTTQSKDQKYTNITHVLQCGDREWGEDGVPVLRREPAEGKEREPGEDSMEEWLK